MNGLDEPVLMAVPKLMQTEFDISHRLGSCAGYLKKKNAVLVCNTRFLCPVKSNCLTSKCNLEVVYRKFRYLVSKCNNLIKITVNHKLIS